MGFFDALMGRSKPKKPKLDNLFAVPGAALTLEVSTDFRPTGVAAVAFRAMEGAAIAQAERESVDLIKMDNATSVRQEADEFGYTWQVVRDEDRDMSRLMTNVHAINSALENQGFGPMLLCSATYFRDSHGQNAAIVYLYKRGTFYPFVQTGKNVRDTAVEFNLKAAIGSDLPMENDTSKWSPLWDAPGMTDS
ncbi:hypothetical protein QP572_04225 [Brevibacterium sp. UMB10442]|nr:hypothetical protein [Brevibacterium sp. UMB10442]